MKRKVLIVVHQLNHGGVQKALLTVLDALDYDKNEVTLYVRKNRIEFLPQVNAQVHKIIINRDTTHYYRKPYAVLCLLQMKFWNLLQAKKKEKVLQDKLTKYIVKSQMRYEKKHYFSDGQEYDVAVSYIQGYNAQFVAEHIKAKRKVMFFHGSTDETHELHERIMPHFDAIVGVNSSVQKVLEELYPRFVDKMTAIDNYIEAEEVRQKAKEKKVQNPEKDEFILCSCGRFTDVKGFDLAVDAAYALKENGVPFLWYFVGDGPNREPLEKQIQRYGLEKNIILTGMQDNPYPWIGVCDVYVQPSREEAHPMTMIEAFLLLKPVVTTNTVGGRYLVNEGQNGSVAQIEGASIADRVTHLYEHPGIREKMIEYLEKIDYSKAKVEYQKKWEELLKG